MGLLQGTTQREYYQGSNFGNYQFTSLDDIIDYFMVSYVGEDKIIPKIKKLDVAFFAQRALQELSFDTFKSIKAQEITVPATLQMILPHDYVNYTKLSWADSSGIKHPLYPTSNTSNPFSIQQDSLGNYALGDATVPVFNADFSTALVDPWFFSEPTIVDTSTEGLHAVGDDTISIENEVLTFKHHAWWHYTGEMSRAYAVWQKIDVTGIDAIELSATGTSAPASGTAEAGILYFGISSVPGDIAIDSTQQTGTIAQQSGNFMQSNNVNPPDLGYIEWIDGTSSSKQLTGEDSVNVSAHNEVYVIVKSYLNYTGLASPNTPTTVSANTTPSTNSIDDLSIWFSTGLSANPGDKLRTTTAGSSTVWSNYKSGTPSENQDDYQDDTYWPMDGNRYGLDPQHAQANGSFFIDQILGKIHFSSNISGKTVILDYISDSLGTNEEMQVHKFAEEAMYKWIAHAILSTSSYGQTLVPRLTREKFAAVRKAKLRLSNLKLEELTQILRGKSKQIKH